MTRAAKEAQPNPFKYPLFRILWIASLAANISVWMQNVGAAWLMATLTSSVLMVALVQTAISLPTFIFGLPSGVLADTIERRKLLLIVQASMLATAVVAMILLLLGVIGPWALLLLTFALGASNTVAITTRQSAIPDAVPGKALVAAVGMTSVAFNAARAIGPAIAGVLLAWLGTEAVFAANILIFGAVLIMEMRYAKPAVKHAPSTENLWDAMRGGLRYVANAPHLHAYLIRTALFTSTAGALWALLPMVARTHPHFGASGYGWLLASLGMGAVAGGLMLERLRARFTLDAVVGTGTFLFAGATVAAALLDQLVLMCAVLLIGGVAWVLNNVFLYAAFQTSVPAWVRARAISLHMMVFHGSLAAGGAFWGVVASYTGVPGALLLSAALILAGLLVTRRFPVSMGKESDFKPSQHWAEPVFDTEPQPDDGPVAVQLEYQIDPDTRAAFVDAIHQLGVTRRRDGARSWWLYRDLANPDRYVERFIIESWAGHLRQQARSTVADKLAEDRVRAFHVGAAPIAITHFIGESNPPRAVLPTDLTDKSEIY